MASTSTVNMHTDCRTHVEMIRYQYALFLFYSLFSAVMIIVLTIFIATF